MSEKCKFCERPVSSISAAKVRIREEFREQLKLAFNRVLETEPDHNELLDA